MKKHIISVSKSQLTRCSSCGRHHHIDSGLENHEFFELKCDFCGGQLINPNATIKPASKFSRSSKIALGLLSASLTFSACDDEDEVVVNNAGVMAGTETAGTETAGTETAGTETAGTEVIVEPAGEEIPQELYGAPPAGEMAGDMMETAGDEMQQPPYSSTPAGEEGE